MVGIVRHLIIKRLVKKRYVTIFLQAMVTVLIAITQSSHLVMGDEATNLDDSPLFTIPNRTCAESIVPNATNLIVPPTVEPFGMGEITLMIRMAGAIAAAVYSDLRGARHVYFVMVFINFICACLGLTMAVLGRGAGLAMPLDILFEFVIGMETPTRVNLVSRWCPNGSVTTSLAIVQCLYNAIFYANSNIWSPIIPSTVEMLFVIPCFIIWTLLAYFNFYSGPFCHPYASEAEKAEISRYVSPRFPNSIPIGKMLKEYRLWTLAFCFLSVDVIWQIGVGVCCFAYFYMVMRLNDEQLNTNDDISTIVNSFGFLVCAIVVDFAIRKWNISVMYLRTLMIAVGIIGRGCFVIYITFTQCYVEFAQTIYTMALVVLLSIYVNFKPATIDVTRHYAGTATCFIFIVQNICTVLRRYADPYLFHRHTLIEFRRTMCMMTIIGASAAFLHYNFTRPFGPSWDKASKAEMRGDLRVRPSEQSLTVYDKRIRRYIQYIRNKHKRIKEAWIRSHFFRRTQLLSMLRAPFWRKPHRAEESTTLNLLQFNSQRRY